MIVAALLGVSLARPQAPGAGDPFTRILSFESFQDGSNFGHELFQEDGTLSGQKIGPDGLTYGFYSYLQPDNNNNRVKVYWRAGQGVGYEVIGVEGINPEQLGNLRAHISATPEPARPVRPRPTAAPAVRRAPVVVQTPAPVVHRAPVLAPATPAPVVHRAPVLPPATPAPVLAGIVTPEPHRFDYPAVLNLERTSNGFVSSLTAV